MIFGNLSERLQAVFEKLQGTKSLSEESLKEPLREVKLALLEADVNIRIVKQFVSQVKEACLGMEVVKGAEPQQSFVSAVHDQLVEVMGRTAEEPEFKKGKLNRLMLVGLQGSGKTTTAGKIALKYKDLNPHLVACDVYRPAAVQQLQTVAGKAGAVFHGEGTDKDPVQIASNGLSVARDNTSSLVIFDTAGRLQIDDSLMSELERMKEEVKPDEVLLVIDSMTGQEAVRVAEEFDRRVGITGVVLTKVDGDARGGAALSVKSTIGKPVKFIGIGEKLDGFEVFDPSRMASRILGLGDVVGLMEKASGVLDETKAKKMQRRMSSGEFNLIDFLEQIEMMNKMGPLQDLVKMMPGINKMADQFDGVEKEVGKTAAIIRSMTMEERMKPDVLNASRKRRIAQGCGHKVQDVNQLIRQFDQMKHMMKQLKKMGLFKPSKLMKGKLPFGF
jgi:signal recognition particle subunit SRP54